MYFGIIFEADLKFVVQHLKFNIWRLSIRMRNVLETSSETRVNSPICNQVFFRPCQKSQIFFINTYYIYVVSNQSVTIYWIDLHIITLFLKKNLLIEIHYKTRLKYENEKVTSYPSYSLRNEALVIFLITALYVIAHFVWSFFMKMYLHQVYIFFS